MQPISRAWQLLYVCLASFRFRAVRSTPFFALWRGRANPKGQKSHTQRRHALSRLVAILMLVSTLLPTTTALAPVASADGTCAAGLQQASFTLDEVPLTLCAPFLPSKGFELPLPNSPQSATALSYKPFQEFTVVAVAYDTYNPFEALPLAKPGSESAAKTILQDFRSKENGNPEPGPTATFFGKQVKSIVSKTQMDILGTAASIVSVEWVLEAGQRLWLIRYSQELATSLIIDKSLPSTAPKSLPQTALPKTNLPFVTALTNITLASSNLNAPSKVLESLKAGTQSDNSSNSAKVQPRNYGYPSWWNGSDCDDTHYKNVSGGTDSYELNSKGGTAGWGSYLGIPACGPEPRQADGYSTSGFPGVQQLEWQCAELVKRYLYQAYQLPALSADGYAVVDTYWDTYHSSQPTMQRYYNGTTGVSPQPGDVISYGYSAPGHTSIVSQNNVNSSNGNGYIIVVEQNNYGGINNTAIYGYEQLNVSSWHVSYGGSAVNDWLHFGSPCTSNCGPRPPADPGVPTVDDTDSGAVIGGTAGYWSVASCANYQCRGSSTHYTSNSLSNNRNNWVEWHPNLPVAGQYQVFVDVPSVPLPASYTTGANYQIHYKNSQVATQVVNQHTHGIGVYEWVSIGTYDFDAGTGDFVYLDDVVPEKSHLQAYIAFDAVSFKLISPDLPPNAPSNLSVAAASTSQINMNWTGNGGDGFYVERKTGTGGTYSRIGQVINTNYQDSSLASNTQYCYRVQAYNSVGASSYSNESCATTLNATTLSVDKTQLNFTYTVGDATPPTQPVMLSTSIGNINVFVSADWMGGPSGWIGYTAASNTVSPNSPIQFNIGVSNNLTAGTYNCDVYFTDSNNAQNYTKFHVILVVQAAPNINIGQGSSYPQNYIDAYNRRSSSFFALDYAQQYPGSSEWWQKLSSGAAIFHDQASSPNPSEIRAYYISGGNLAYYLGLGGPNSWLGVPTSDEFLNANNLWQVDYANGYAYDNGQGTIITTAWPSNVSGWKVSYWNNPDLESGTTYVTNDTTDTGTNLNVSWPIWAAPMPQEGLVFDNNWSARFEQVVNFQIGQYYRITACGDDGVRVFMSGSEVINGWQDQNLTCYNYFYYQDAISPNNVPIKIEYFQNIGGASLQFTITPITLQLSPLLSNGQATQINTQFPNNLSVLVTDQFGDYVNGVTVALSAPTSGASGTWPAGITPGNVSNITTLPSDNNGVAATTYPFTANNIAGIYTVTATANGVSGVNTTFTLTNLTGPAASVAAQAGSSQSTQINTAFGTNLQVLVKDTGGNALSGVAVTFTAPSNNASGTFSSGTSATVNTDANGIATAPTFTANNTAGTYTVVASVNGLASTASFALTNTSPPTTVATTAPTTVATTAPTAAPTTAPTNSPTTIAPTTTNVPTVAPTTPTPAPINNFAYTYNLPYVANNGAGIGGNYTTNVTLQNTGDAPANFTITYYDNSGNTLATYNDNGGTLAPNTKYNAIGLVSGQSGAATIVSTQPLSIVVSESGTFNGQAIASSYPDINTTTGVGSTIYAPIALNHSYGAFSTGFVLRNTGTSDTTVTIQYYNDFGNATGSQTVAIKAGNTVQVLQSDAAAGLSNNFSGWASITSNNGQPLAGIDVETNPSTGFVATVACTATPGKSVVVPVVFQGAFGNFVTGVQLVNPNNTTANVTVTITRKDGTVMKLSATHASFQMAAHSDKSFFHSTDVFPELLTTNGGFVGSAVVTSDQPLLTIVNQTGSVGGVSFNGSFGTLLGGAAQVNMPGVFKNAFAYSSGLQIVNTSSTASTATITYYDSNGNKVYQSKLTADDGGPIKPGGSINPYQGTDSNLPDGFSGTAVIAADTNGASFVVVGNISNAKIFYTYAEPN